MKNFNNLNIIELRKLSDKDYEDITKLILEENKSSILASLNKKIIKQYLNNIISSDTVFLFVVKLSNKIIGYSIIAEKTDSLISIFSNLKIKVLFLLIINFKIITLINLILGYLKIDILHLNKKHKQIIEENYNLNLLAIDKKFQSFGFKTKIINGHNYKEIRDGFNFLNKNDKKMKILIANTIKGKGISYMENKAEWHYWQKMTSDQKIKMFEELNAKISKR